MEQFTESLTGVKPEETRTFTVDYPEDYNSKGLAGKKVEYVTEVTAVRQKELPEFDDEWAKSLGGDFDSAETLKTKVREDLEARSAAESDRRLRDELIRKLIDTNQFDVPQSLIEQQTGHRLQELARQMMSRGIDPNNQQLNWEAATEEMRVQAEGDVRATMLLEKIADAENITVSKEKVEAEIEG